MFQTSLKPGNRLQTKVPLLAQVDSPFVQLALLLLTIPQFPLASNSEGAAISNSKFDRT